MGVPRAGMDNSRYTQPKDEEDGELPGKPTPAQSSISSPPIFPLLIPDFGFPFLLRTPGHVVQFRSLPLGTKSGNGNHLHMRPGGTGGIFMLETSVRTRRVPMPRLNQRRNLTSTKRAHLLTQAQAQA